VTAHGPPAAFAGAGQDSGVVLKDGSSRGRRKAELAEALARLDVLLEHAPVGFGFYDTDFRYVRVNAALAEITGLPVDEHPGRRVADVNPDVWRSVGDLFRHVLETGEPILDREVSAQTPAAPSMTRHWLASIYPVSSSDGTVLGLGSVVVDITERKRAELAERLLARASELFSSTLDLDTVIEGVVRLAIPDFADSCHLYLVEPGGDGRRVAMADVDADLEPVLVEAAARFPTQLEGDLPTATALRTGHTQRVEHVTDTMRSRAAQSPEHLELLRRHGACSVMTTPVAVGDRRHGVLVLMYTGSSRRHYQSGDEALAEELANRLALVIERARLFEEAERARARVDLLATVSELLTVELSSRARLAALSRIVLPAFADLCAVHLAEPDGRLRVASFAAAEPDLQALIDSITPRDPVDPDPRFPWARAVASGEPVLLSNIAEGRLDELTLGDDRRRTFAHAMGVRSVLSVPLPGPDAPIGAVSFGYGRSGRRYRPDDIPLARELARRAAPAVEHALAFEHERATAETLQRSLLPERLPDLPELALAARYVPGSEELAIGGDWYDVLALPGGRVVFAIGDVVGHGVRAAAMMGKIRQALSFCARDGLSPGAILARLNTHFSGLEDSDMATLLIVSYNPYDGTIRYASAGHPPALLHTPREPVAYLPGGRGAPLCASDHVTYPETEATLPADSLLLLYTDGLIERRGESLDEGFKRLADAVAAGPAEVHQLADDLLGQLLGKAPPADDVALLAVRTQPATEALELHVAAQPRDLLSLRSRLRAWLMARGASAVDASEITLAVNEAATNAVEHAYGLDDADFSVQARRDGQIVTVVVRDSGRWREPAGGLRGRGVELMRGLMEDVEVESGPDGTTVVMRRRLRGEGEE
jgi:PAS domain S-box-containing protein